MANSFLDKTGLGLVWAQIKLLLAGKVDKVDGKGLSSNDYTADEKAKLANIQAGAEVNVNADWDAVTGDSAILNKPTIPTATSDLTNDSGFITAQDVPEAVTVDDALDDASTNPVANSVITNQLNTLSASIPTNNNQLTNGAGYQTASDVNSLIATAVGDLEGVDFEIVDTLPATGDKAKIYLVPLETSGTDNIYDEYIWIASSSTYEKIGTTDVDLSDYYNTTNLVPITSTEINTICQ